MRKSKFSETEIVEMLKDAEEGAPSPICCGSTASGARQEAGRRLQNAFWRPRSSGKFGIGDVNGARDPATSGDARAGVRVETMRLHSPAKQSTFQTAEAVDGSDVPANCR